MEFKTIVKRLRVENKMTQKQVAQALKLSERNYQSFESGAICPSFDTLNNMADLFHVSADCLLGRGLYGKVDFIDDNFDVIFRALQQIVLSESNGIWQRFLDSLSAATLYKKIELLSLIVSDIVVEGDHCELRYKFS